MRPSGGNGTVEAPTSALVVEGLDGKEIHSGRRGLQLLNKASAWSNKTSDVPREKLFADDEDNSKSVGLALGPFLEAFRQGALRRAEPAAPSVSADSRPSGAR